MQRRSFLKSAASALPIALAARVVHALDQSSTTAPTAPQIHLVRAQDDRFGEFHGPGYNDLRFKTSATETPSLFAMEHTKLLPGSGPPLHFHFAQEEWFYVMDGEVLIQIGDQRMTLQAGDSVVGPRHIPHAFVGIGPNPARMLITYTPAGQMEQFFRETAALGRQDKNIVSGRYGVKVVGPRIRPDAPAAGAPS